jgi:predicted transcriptional regulator
MSATTSLKLSDALKSTIVKVAAFEGKSAHALMVDTLQAAMDDALLRQQFYAAGEASYQDSLRSNAVFSAAEVKAYVMARVKSGPSGSNTGRPQARPLDTAQPMTSAYG